MILPPPKNYAGHLYINAEFWLCLFFLLEKMYINEIIIIIITMTIIIIIISLLFFLGTQWEFELEANS